jgi:hypothetical protein
MIMANSQFSKANWKSLDLQILLVNTMYEIGKSSEVATEAQMFEVKELHTLKGAITTLDGSAGFGEEE